MINDNDYSSTNYRFVENPRKSNTSRTIDNSVIRNETGNLHVRACRPVIHVEKKQSRHIQEFNGNTVVDILNRLQQRKNLYKIVMDI